MLQGGEGLRHFRAQLFLIDSGFSTIANLKLPYPISLYPMSYLLFTMLFTPLEQIIYGQIVIYLYLQIDDLVPHLQL